MKKVIFCNISYMKNYCGSENDIPVNGGKYIEENNDGGEVFNFLDYNGKCYGYFMHYADTLHLERIDGSDPKQDYVDDVLVVWVAKKPEISKNVIVGWYKNARIYRRSKNDFSCSTFGFYPDPERALDYNIVSDAKDCFLLPEYMRTFIIPRAAKAGQGRGMGQSAIWYADSDYAKNEFVPSVLEFISECDRNGCKYINKVYTDEMLSKAYEGEKSVDELTEIAKDMNTPAEEALEYINAALKSETNADLLLIKADILRELFRFDKALELYEKSYEGKEDINVLIKMHYMYLLTQQYEKAAVTAEIIEADESFSEYDDEAKTYFYEIAFHTLGVIHKLAKAQTYLSKLKDLHPDDKDELDSLMDIYC